MEPIIYTPYSREQILLAFQRALNDLTDAEIFALRDQEAEARAADVYTLSQAIAAINADLAAHYVRSTALDAEAAERAAADRKQCAALTELLDSGAKNLLSVTSGSNTLPTRWIQIPVRVQPGTYRMTFGSLVSDDTDSTTCQCIGFSSENLQVTNTMQLARGTGISGVMTVTGEVAYIRIYRLTAMHTARAIPSPLRTGCSVRRRRMQSRRNLYLTGRPGMRCGRQFRRFSRTAARLCGQRCRPRNLLRLRRSVRRI